MGDYRIISKVSQAIVELLRQKLVPENIANEELIGLCSPSDKGDFSLGVYLYDIQEDENYYNHDMVEESRNRQRYPASYYSLYYAITAYSSSDAKFRAEEEQKLLGAVLQVLRDYNVLNHEVQKELEAPSLDIRIQMLGLDLEEKRKLWSSFNLPYQLSLFYKVLPIEIESNRTKRITRVMRTDFQMEE